MADVFDFLAGFDAQQPDGLLLALASAPGVDETTIRITSTPRRWNHGHHAVTWSQDGRTHCAEASSLATALQRAVRASGGGSAHPGPHAPDSSTLAASIFRAGVR